MKFVQRKLKSKTLNVQISWTTRAGDKPEYPRIRMTITSDSNLAMNIDWAAETALGSDHRPITLRLTCDITTIATPHRTFINFKKADWKGFTEETERRFGKTKPFKMVHEAEKNIQKNCHQNSGQAHLTRLHQDNTPQLSH